MNLPADSRRPQMEEKEPSPLLKGRGRSVGKRLASRGSKSHDALESTWRLSPKRVQQLLRAATRQRILVVGDVMLDQFLWGSVARISPEAPVPVVDFERESSMPGGAANVARNLTALG